MSRTSSVHLPATAVQRNLRTAGSAAPSGEFGDEVVERERVGAPRKARGDRSHRQALRIDRPRNRVDRFDAAGKPAVDRAGVGPDVHAGRRERGVPRREIEIVRVERELGERDGRERREPRPQREVRVAGATRRRRRRRRRSSRKRRCRPAPPFATASPTNANVPFDRERRPCVHRHSSGERSARRDEREPFHAMVGGAAGVAERESRDACRVRPDPPVEVRDGDLRRSRRSSAAPGSPATGPRGRTPRWRA